MDMVHDPNFDDDDREEDEEPPFDDDYVWEDDTPSWGVFLPVDNSLLRNKNFFATLLVRWTG